MFLVDLDYEDLKLFLCLISFTFKCSVINDGKFINNEYNDVYLITTLDPIPLEAFTLQVRSAIIFISWHIITLDAIIWIWFLYKWISSTLVELTLSFQFNSWFTPFFFSSFSFSVEQHQNIIGSLLGSIVIACMDCFSVSWNWFSIKFIYLSSLVVYFLAACYSICPNQPKTKNGNATSFTCTIIYTLALAQ